MTAAFDNFLKQYNSSGSQKADGYNQSHFKNLTNTEKYKAFELLEEELIAPDVTDWLLYLDESRAINTMKQYISNVTPGTTAGVHRIYNALYKATGDQQYLDGLINSYKDYFDWEKEEALWLIRNNNPAIETTNNLYKNILNTEENPKAQALAADFYLRNKGYTCNSKEESKSFFNLKEQLISLNINERKNLLANLESQDI